MTRLTLTSVATLLLFAAPASAQFLAVTYNGDFLRVDPATGAGTLLFSTGVQGMQGMTLAAHGRIWCVQRAGVLYPRIWEVDLVLGSVHGVHPTFLNDAFDIATSPSGDIFVETVTGGSQCRLYLLDLLDPSGSSPQLVGDVKIGNQYVQVLGMTFAPNGVLYGWGTSHGLVTIDPFTALATDVDGLLIGTNDIQDLAYAPDGFLYGGYQNLFRIDPTTGVKTLIGGPMGGGDVRGLEHYTFATPTIYCAAKGNSAGCVPTINVGGSSSLSGPDDLVVGAFGVIPQRPGLLLWGSAPQQVPFGGGDLCVGGTIRRKGGQVSAGTPPCAGTYAALLDHAWMAGNGLGPGSRIYTQWWSRDVGFPAPLNVGLTDGAEIEILP